MMLTWMIGSFYKLEIVMGAYLKSFISFVIIILLLIGAFKLYNLGKEGYTYMKVHGLRSVIENIMEPDSVSQE